MSAALVVTHHRSSVGVRVFAASDVELAWFEMGRWPGWQVDAMAVLSMLREGALSRGWVVEERDCPQVRALAAASPFVRSRVMAGLEAPPVACGRCG